jgi:hypothetical protein
MNSRILELISSPESIAQQDLSLLKEEISVQPYAQSLRALYLLGTKKYDAENFQKVLSTTAAYTTDKKILYQFINGKIYEVKSPETEPIKENFIVEEPIVIEETTATIINEDVQNVVETREEKAEIPEEENWLAALPKPPIPKEIIAEGEVNRILFEGEENFLNEEPIEKIDLEASAESGILVSEKIETSPSIQLQNEELNIENNEVSIENETEEIKELPSSENESNEVNFHNENNFTPEVIVANIKTKEAECQYFTPKKEVSSENKYELERKRLAEEIEQKMASNKKPSESNLQNFPEVEDATVNFSSTQEFLPETEVQSDENIDEVPAINISFFANDMPSLNHENILLEQPKEEKIEQISNVPTFINTWQNWLKIDRTSSKISEEITIEEDKEEEEIKSDLKAEAIEKFIVTEPKISKFKEDGTFKVQEKKDDINHLMTETLANLFWTQKLYDKATNAYETLKEKHPEKSDYYNQKIVEIQASKQK